MSQKTALILIDLYNDFLHPKGKATSALAPSLDKSKTIEHIFTVLNTARQVQIPIYYSFHQQYRPGKFDGFQHWNATLQNIEKTRSFEEGSWGAQVYEGLGPDLDRGETVVSKHWNSSSFENTDLNWLLKRKDITHLVFAGLVANTCVETTARVANELYVLAPGYGHQMILTRHFCLSRGYKITLLNDATADWTIESMEAAVEHSWPSFAHEILSTEEWRRQITETG